MKSALTLLLWFAALLSSEANPKGAQLLPTQLNQILAAVELGTERKVFLKQIKDAFPESYLAHQVGGLANGTLDIRLNKRYELGAKVTAGKVSWVISEKKFWLTDLQSMTCTIVSIETIKTFNPTKAVEPQNEEAEQDAAEQPTTAGESK